MKQTISFVTLAVHDFARELNFYQNALGWEPFNVMEGTIAFFNVGSCVFSICEYKELSEDIGKELKTKAHLGAIIAQNLPSERAVDEVFADLRAANVSIVKEPTKASWGGYSGYFADPEGHLWEIAYNPQFEYDSDGTMIIPS